MNVIQTAEKELGVTAKQGTANNPRVLEYFQKVGHSWVHDDQTAWCAAFVGFILETCGIRSTRLLNARSYLKWGERASKPIQGDVVVFWRESKDSALGHVSFFHHEDEKMVYCLGGNQVGESVTIQGYPKTRVLDYRRAINAPQAQPIKKMDITKETPQKLKIKGITVTYDHYINDELMNEDFKVDLELTDEMLELIKKSEIVLPDYNITVE